jgi:hypothetical protein
VMTPSPLIIPSGSRSGFTSEAVLRLSFVVMWLPVSLRGQVRTKHPTSVARQGMASEDRWAEHHPMPRCMQ